MGDVAISDAEWQVMNVIWDGQPLTSQEVVAALEAHTKWAPATIKTMLHRLVRKGALKYEPQGNRYVYRAAAKRSDCIKQASRSFLDRVFEGESSSLMVHFLRQSKLSPEEIAELRRILNEQEAR
jgi:BlaI family penicillinase repressor